MDINKRIITHRQPDANIIANTAWILFFTCSSYLYSYGHVRIDAQLVDISVNTSIMSLHYTKDIATIAGLLLCALIAHISQHLFEKTIPFTICALCISFLGISLRTNLGFMIVCIYVLSCCLGYILAATSYMAILMLFDHRRIGFLWACGYSLSILLQALLLNRPASFISHIVFFSSLLGFLLLFEHTKKSLHIDTASSAESEDRIPVESTFNQHHILLLSAIVFCGYFFFSFYDRFCVYYSITTDSIMPYGAFRLFLALGIFLAGCIYDYASHRYMPLLLLCSMVLALLLPLFTQELSIGFPIFYFSYGCFVGYFTLMFWSYAMAGSHSPLLAVWGRVLEFPTIIITEFIPSIDSYVFMYTLLALLLLVTLILLVVDQQILFSSNANVFAIDQAYETAVQLDEQSQIAAFADSYHLTEKETEVFRSLITTEDNLQQIADSMYISRRVLQRHITEIYMKTGVQSRIGLYQLLNNSTKKEPRPKA